MPRPSLRRPAAVLLALAGVLAVVATACAAEAFPGRRGDPGRVVGTPAPPLALDGWLGESQEIDALRGDVVLVRWWTDTCPFCAASAPAINELHARFAPRGLRVIGVFHPKPPGDSDVSRARRAAERFGFTFPVALDPDWRALRRWWLDAVPGGWTSVTFLVDRAGTIRYVHPGGEFHEGAGGDHWADHASCNREHAELVALIESLLDEPGPARDAGLGLGMHRLDPRRGVVDGDTLRVAGQPEPLRLVGLDAEELFRSADERREADRDFDAYARARRGDARRPVKYGTPAGEAAREWMEDVLSGAREVRLELDRPGRTHGYFGRPLVHVFVPRPGGGDSHLNVEAVRAGMSPYFVKYGRSARFDAAFRAAEREARDAGRGIWSDRIRHYPDYDERLAWWAERAGAIEAWERATRSCEECVRLADDGAWESLVAREGEVVTLFGEIGAPRLDRAPFLLPLKHRLHRDVPLVAWTRRAILEFAEAAGGGDHVRVRGRVSLHRGRPQILAEDVEDLRAP